MIIFRCRTILVIAFCATSCTQSESPNEWICESARASIQIGTSANEQRNVVDQCILKWSYRLGRSQGPNREIAKAVSTACKGAVEEYQGLFVREAGEVLTTAQLDQLESDIAEFEDEALFRVIQGRAGNCSDRPEGEQ